MRRGDDVLGGCAPMMVKPGVSQVEANSDSFGCKMVARAAAPGGSYAEGKIGFVIAVTAISALATAAERSSVYTDRMAARGYVPATNAAYGAASPPPAAAPVALTTPQRAPPPFHWRTHPSHPCRLLPAPRRTRKPSPSIAIIGAPASRSDNRSADEFGAVTTGEAADPEERCGRCSDADRGIIFRLGKQSDEKGTVVRRHR